MKKLQEIALGVCLNRFYKETEGKIIYASGVALKCE